MVEIPDRLECLFSASVEEAGDLYTIEVPKDEAERMEAGREAVLPLVMAQTVVAAGS